jgi:hypothetical protein
VERFLKKGILDKSPDDEVDETDDADEGGEEDAEVSVGVVDDGENAGKVGISSGSLEKWTWEPTADITGVWLRFISPKYFSVSLTASSCGYPANATTILSGLKNVDLYLSTVALSITDNLSRGHNRGLPNVLSL